MLPVFVAPKNRDAWRAIRGYVYQIDLTIERWLDLGDGQQLILECGEDVDTCSRHLDPGDETRLLEQIKCLDATITLRRPCVVATIARALAHIAQNPGVRLVFRFTTNVRPAKEQHSPFAGSTSAISVWEQLRRTREAGDPLALPGTMVALSEEQLLSGIRQILLSNHKRPTGLDEATWAQYRDFVTQADHAALLTFVHSFEWSLDQGDSDEVCVRIQRRLIDSGRAGDAAAAWEQYQRLFLHVIHRLRAPGEKRLLPEDIAQIICSPSSEAERGLFERIMSQTGLLDHRLQDLQSRFGRQEDRLVAVANQLSQFFEHARIQALTLQRPLPTFEPPPIGDRIAPRTQTVAQLRHEMDGVTWLALTGGSGSGKSHLAMFVTARFSACPLWLRLRDLDPAEAAGMLDSALLFLAEQQTPTRDRQFYAAACHRFGAGAVLVLDDLPRLTTGDPLAERLAVLERACRDSNVKLLTTSLHHLPQSVRTAIGERVAQRAVPILTDLEAGEILLALGAPAPFVAEQKRVRLLNSLTRFHPALLTAAALYLEAREWKFSDDHLEQLFRGDYVNEVNEETMYRLLATVTDEPSRELLYRLNLVIGDFDLDTARLVAAIEPPVSAPRERLERLRGLWLQRDFQDRLRVSPMIGAFGTNDLSEAVRTRTNVALANDLLQKRTLSPNDLMNVLAYLGAGKEHGRAVAILIRSLSQLREDLDRGEITREQAARTGLAELYWSLPVPELVDLNSQLLLRSLQVSIGSRLAKKSDFVLAELIRLIDRSGPKEASGLLTAVVFAAGPLVEHDFATSCRCIQKALDYLPALRTPDGRRLRLPAGVAPDTMVWWNLGFVRTPQDALVWCDLLANLPESRRTKSLREPRFEAHCAGVLMDRLWRGAIEQESDQAVYEALLLQLDIVAARAGELGVCILLGSAIRAKIAVLCHGLDLSDRAVEVAKQSLAEHRGDTVLEYLICDGVGQRLSYVAGQESESTIWLDRARGISASFPVDYNLFRALTLICSARMADHVGDADGCVAFLHQAVELLQSYELAPEIELVKCLGELSLALWKKGDRPAAFKSLDDAISRMLCLRSAKPEWRALYTLFAHTVSYMTHSLTMGNPPSYEDGMPFVFLPIGNFHNNKETELAAHYTSNHDVFLPALMVRFAQSSGRDDRVPYWVDVANAVTRDQPGAALAESIFSTAIIPHLARANRFEELFDVARETAFSQVAELTLFQRGEVDGLLQRVDVEAVLGGRGTSQWDTAEIRSLEQSLIPITFQLGILCIKARVSDVDKPQFENACELSVELCERMAIISTRSADWLRAASLIRECFSSNPVMQRVVAQAGSFTDDQLGLKLLGYIGATMERAVPLREACRGHMSVLPWSLHHCSENGFYRLLLLPFVESYWGTAVAQRRWSFTPPAQAEREMTEACALPIPERAKRIMRAVAQRLGVSNDTVVATGFRYWDEVDRAPKQVNGSRRP